MNPVSIAMRVSLRWWCSYPSWWAITLDCWWWHQAEEARRAWVSLKSKFHAGSTFAKASSAIHHFQYSHHTCLHIIIDGDMWNPFLAVRDSSIGDLVTHSLTKSDFWFQRLQSTAELSYTHVTFLTIGQKEALPTRRRQRQIHWERFIDLVIQLTVSDKLRNSNHGI